MLNYLSLILQFRLDSSDEMKNFLTMQQKAMELLIETVNKDMRDLKIIAEGMNRSFGTSVN